MPTCPSCARQLSPEWKFCIHCGADLSAAEPAAPITDAPAPLLEVPVADAPVADAPVADAPLADAPTSVAEIREAIQGETVPAAIRPEPAQTASDTAGDASETPAAPASRRTAQKTERQKTKLDVPLLIGVVLGIAGVALIVYMGIELFGPGR
ncbi:zinc ribbon domain-containing protein [Homoserinimonas aerilata]|uniref:zinc ribbon domain-containing protein n=1 Tax=Homoserinimonas aerilata TaxID=1162970 RepID=UPI00115067CB|nr:zinc ribbon domain-containing protein [Homoserinimonas aerilata]